jgi:hypothetical protein
VIGLLGASVVLAGCAGNSASPPAPKGVGSDPWSTRYHWWFNTYNDSNKNDPAHPNGEYIWVTRYWNPPNVFNPWENMGADCVAPGQAIQSDIAFPPTEYGSTETVKLRVEVKAYGAKGCNGETISDFYSDQCSGYFFTEGHWKNYWWLGTAKVVVRPPHFQWDLHCKNSEGPQAPPPLDAAVTPI